MIEDEGKKEEEGRKKKIGLSSIKESASKQKAKGQEGRQRKGVRRGGTLARREELGEEKEKGGIERAREKTEWGSRMFVKKLKRRNG